MCIVYSTTAIGAKYLQKHLLKWENVGTHYDYVKGFASNYRRGLGEGYT